MKKYISLAAMLVLTVTAIGFTAKPAKANFPDGAEAWADQVFSFNQGLRRDGTPVLPEKSDPWQSLGLAEGADGTTIISPGSGVSLGFKGELTIKFENTILNQPGKDLTVVVVNDGQPDRYRNQVLSRGRIVVRVSQNCWTYRTIGALSKTGSLDLGLYRWAKCVQILDRTANGRYAADADGFDVDGVMALHTTADQPWTGTMYDTRWWRIDADPENNVWMGHDLKKAERWSFCNSLWDQAVAFHNNWIMNSIDGNAVALREAYFSTNGRSSYDGMTVEQLHEYLSTTLTCDGLTARNPAMRNLLVQLTDLNKGKSLWSAAVPVAGLSR